MFRFAGVMARVGIFVAIAYCSISGVQVYALEESTGPGGSNAIAVHQLGETGQDVNIGLILARNVLTTHEAFKDSNGVSHAFNYDFSGSGISVNPHDTQLAGIIASRGGALYPNDLGVAPGADIHCARVSDSTDGISSVWLSNALNDLITTRQCRVIVTGFEIFGTGVTLDGNSFWTMLYDYYAYQNNVIFANPAGNQNNTITIFGDAYNGFSTGGLRLNDPNDENEYRMVGSISGSGPTVDGRRKPEITGPSQNQTVPTSYSNTYWVTVGTTLGETSYSVPHAAGAAAVLLGLADKTDSPNDNSSEVIKAILTNSAMPNVKNKSGVSTSPADFNHAWQKDRGYGRLDVLRAYQMLDTNEIEPDTYISQDKGWGFGRLEPGQTDTYTISISARCRLIATIDWQRRIEWTDNPPRNHSIDPGELTAYLADLDMTVYAPGEPNAIFRKDAFGFNPNNNLVKCDLLILSPGDYTIVISNDSTNGESANYGFAFDLHPIMPGDINEPDYIVDMNDLNPVMQDWLSDNSVWDSLLSPNGIIDFADFAQLAQNWLQIDPFYYQY